MCARNENKLTLISNAVVNLEYLLALYENNIIDNIYKFINIL